MRRFQIICRRQHVGSERLLILRSVIHPVVVPDDDGALAVVQHEERIRQRIGDPEIGQRRPNAAHDHLGKTASASALRIKPPIMTFSPVPTFPRVLMLANLESAVSLLRL